MQAIEQLARCCGIVLRSRPLSKWRLIELGFRWPTLHRLSLARAKQVCVLSRLLVKIPRATNFLALMASALARATSASRRIRLLSPENLRLHGVQGGHGAESSHGCKDKPASIVAGGACTCCTTGYPSEAQYQQALSWRYREDLEEFLTKPGSFRALEASGVNIAWLHKRLKVKPWQPVVNGSMIWHRAPLAQSQVQTAQAPSQGQQSLVADSMPCADFGLGFLVPGHAAVISQAPSPAKSVVPWYDKAAVPHPPLPMLSCGRILCPWEVEAHGASVVYSPLPLDDAATPGSLAQTIEQAASPGRNWADGLAPPPPPPPPPVGWVGTYYGHCRPPLPPPAATLEAPPAPNVPHEAFYIGSENGDELEQDCYDMRDSDGPEDPGPYGESEGNQHTGPTQQWQ